MRSNDSFGGDGTATTAVAGGRGGRRAGPSRRAVLAGLAVGAAGLAGCLGGSTGAGGRGAPDDWSGTEPGSASGGASSRRGAASRPRASGGFAPVNYTYRGRGIVYAEYYPRATTQLETHEWELPATVVLNPPKVTRYGSFRETNPFTVEVQDNNPSSSTQAVNFLLRSALSLYDQRDDTELLFQYWTFDHDSATGAFEGVLRAEYNNEISNTINLPEELYEGLVLSMPTSLPDGCEIRGFVDESNFRMVVHGTNGLGEYIGVYIETERV